MDAIDELDQKVDLLIQQYRSEKLRADEARQQLAALQAERGQYRDLLERAGDLLERSGYWGLNETIRKALADPNSETSE